MAAALDSTGVEEGLKGWSGGREANGGHDVESRSRLWTAPSVASPGGARKDGLVMTSPRWHQVWALSCVQEAGH